ncbi:uncharacterized protein LOC124169252 isoform X1 [Ischnura elegans]|uniref:uncharacterized protein LOC124169252 isoform X1 n=1 Tax=Ischnura elegans TaxID=197161 RepID=UPI001ED8AE58|nr:uncharacterized protein LOC124169252 isoform X1 [Ischnura elegans]
MDVVKVLANVPLDFHQPAAMSKAYGLLFLSCVFVVSNSAPIATLDPISNNGLRNIPKNSCHVNGEVFEDGDQVIMTRADLNGEMDPCESCLCVRGEVFCWWGGCPPRHSYPPPTPRPLSGHPSSISPPSSTSSPSGAGASAFGERPTLSPPLPPADEPSARARSASSQETSTPEYPEDEEEEERGESAPLGLGRRHEGTKSEGLGEKGESFLGSLTAKPNSGGGSKEGAKRADDDFEGDMGVGGLEKSPPAEGASELVDTVSETGDLEKQSRQQQSPSLDMFDVDAF